MTRIYLKNGPKLNAKYKAFTYQHEAFLAVRDLEYAAIFHEQGLGKSKIAIDLILYWLVNGIVDTVLLVAKRSLVANWTKEFSAHTFIKPKILTQSRRKNFFVFNSPCKVIMAHYEVVKSEKERFELFLKTRDVAIIVDESAKIKNPDSTLTNVFLGLADKFKKRIIMTGTPVANRPYDIWSQIKFLDGGKNLGNDFTTFKSNTNLTNDLGDDQDAKYDFETAISKIHSSISEFTVREVKNSGIIELPDKIIETIVTDWEPNQLNLYNQIKEEMKALVVKEGVPFEDESSSILKRLLRLVQIASNPHLIDESYSAKPGKFDHLLDIIDKVVQQSEKCIIWSSFTENVDWLAEELSHFGTCKIHGKLTIEKRNQAIEDFLSDKDIMILIATPGAAKEGLTLTVANHVIFYDRGFSPDDYLQAQDRIHRISQEKTCYIYNLIMKDSIDEWVDSLLEGKILAARLAQGDITLDYYQSQMLYDFGEILRNILEN
jgi:SNF2 family DNA or RNA helicase